MGVSCLNPFVDLIERVRSWVSFMSGVYCDCQSLIPGPTSGHRCRNCGRLFCGKCMHVGLDQPKLCKSCYQGITSNLRVTHLEDLSNLSSPRSSRSGDDEDGDDSGKQFFNLPSESSQNIPDVDSVSLSSRLRSVNSSPVDSPCRSGEVVDHEDLLESSSHCSVFDNLSMYRNHETKKVQQPLDFENNRLIWDPPLPEDENDDVETGFVGYDDEDDDIGVSSNVFSSGSFGSNSFSMRERPCDAQKEQLRSAVRGHFRALVSQLLKGEGLEIGSDSGGIGWLDIVSSLAWQAATFVKPDTSKGSSMDPGSYVKVKCVLSGSPSNSTLIKGVVCTKNVKHKRMITQHRTPKIFLLGGALEYLRVSNKLASINTVLKQENDHLKACISKIEVHRPNVLLVEKSASPYAQEYLLTKEISLVLNVKRTLLERIARCTGATIAPSLDNIGSARVGHCEMFRVEKFSEESSSGNNPNRKTIKALMFFDGCPRRSGCTVLLRGKHREELKKVKHVVQYASFAAYHLSRETSFLADEGASLPKTPSNPSFLSTSAAHNANQIVAGDHRRHSSCSNDSTISLFQCANVLSLEMDNSQLSGEEAREPSDYHVNASVPEEIMIDTPEERRILEIHEEVGEVNENEASEYYSADSHSILVSVSTSCVLKETVCEPSQLIRIKFYGSFDKPLGRYLRDDLFDQTSYCGTCKEPAEAHVRCYTHQHGSLTVSVRRHPLMTLPGERDGRIWMWHRCLMCEQSDGVPPAARRVVMSDAAWGLSFGKFLELCFSNHATANRVASCGHSLQKDCLHFYGCGNMVAFFRYSPVDILSVHLPPLVLDFASQLQQEWAKKEAADFLGKIEFLHLEVTKVLRGIEQKITTSEHEPVKTSIHKYIMDLKELLNRERNYYDALLQPDESSPLDGMIDVLELNRLRRCLLIDSQTWERRLCLLDSFSKSNSTTMLHPQVSQFAPLSNLKEWQVEPIKHHEELNFHALESNLNSMVEMDLSIESIEGYGGIGGLNLVSGVSFLEDDENTSLERVPSAASNLSDKIDSLWSGNPGATGVRSISLMDNPLYRNVVSPLRVNSFDSALRFRDRLHGPSSSLHLTSVRSFDASVKRSNLAPSPNPMFISSASHVVGDGARLLLQPGHDDLVIVLYENEPSTIISYAISSKDHTDFVSLNHKFNKEAIGGPSISQCMSDEEFQRLQLNSMLDLKDPHFKFSFDDESSIPTDKVKFSVTCYFATQFYRLRKKCCPKEADFLRSLSHCKKWNAQGGKSNVYFAKSFDERFIIKQVTKTELDSFEVFAPEYFKYMTESINSGSPTCLAKVLGIFQVTVRHLKGGREVRMDLMIMENLFFGRTLSKVYDLKGSSRARYNPDTSGNNNVLLDLNLLESLRTKPIFLGSKAKRRLDRAVWNDTSFLATIDVMDYSLLVGIDDEKKELVIGIIDFMRQYTWDKHLETWVKAAGILGGPKNASPTVVSPLQYKKRFRKAMSKYFLTVPDQWSSL